MNVLIACEFSGVVRDAFRARGHEAWSCDILDSEVRDGNNLGHIYHLKGDVRRVLRGDIPRDMIQDSVYRPTPMFRKWDLMIAHPPCTFLTNAGVRWLYFEGRAGNGIDKHRWIEMEDACAFFNDLIDAPIEKIAIENPIPHTYAANLITNPYAQIIHPWQFGHGETKATCLWLENLPRLVPTEIVEGRTPRVHHVSPGPDRWKERSRTLQGIADAMAAQWG